MKAAFTTGLILGSSTAVLGNECSAGFIHKSDMTGLMCLAKDTSAANCNSECCMQNKATCGGIDADTPIVCPFNQYKPGTDAWKNTAATKDNAKTTCCMQKATCSQATCPAGYKVTSTAADLTVLCAGDAKECGLSFGAAGTGKCCVPDPLTCGGVVAPGCTANVDAEHVAGDKKLKSDAWKKTPLNGQTAKKACCKAYPKCSSAQCPAGYKTTTTADKTKACTDKGGAASILQSDCNRDPAKAANKCCVKDTDTCFGSASVAKSCGAGTFISSAGGSIASAASATSWKAACCSKVATCASATCPAGYKKRAAAAAAPCSGGAKSCTKDSAAIAACCEVNTNTCGGQVGIMCPYGYYDESTSWTAKTANAIKDEWKNRAANATTKNVNCCTAREACSSGTTTPSPLTATPAASPALKYAAHNHDSNDKAFGFQAVWLACGALTGVAVIFVVKSTRPKNLSIDSDVSSDDGEVLLGTNLS